ncbi:hypothetical protein MSAN_01476600 [Mycena sanguinolenta]|uniref:HMG box domain-containing protein n=1 Tax=Mycena sanguinolenta TaxID=230812 RepID=A0A8H6YC23_9AGAR|nr:hypothetical protein MSAN_01476600 [Mycena sanguinolenta]
MARTCTTKTLRTSLIPVTLTSPVRRTTGSPRATRSTWTRRPCPPRAHQFRFRPPPGRSRPASSRSPETTTPRSRIRTSRRPGPRHRRFPLPRRFLPPPLLRPFLLCRTHSRRRPPSSFEDHSHHLRAGSGMNTGLSVSPHDTQTQAATPAWAAQLWDSPPPSASRHLRTPSSPRSVASHALRHSPLAPRERRDSTGLSSLSSGLSLSNNYLFPSTSSSAPSGGNMNTIRAYSSQRAESFSTPDDREATVRRVRRSLRGASVVDDITAVGEAGSSVGQDSGGAHETPPQKSLLRPPKLAPSAWQLYFTDWIQRQQASSSRKLNVAQAAKEAGAEYASLTEEEKEPYKRRSQAAKDVRERLHSEYMRTLTPEDIKRENAFRAAQRKAGKSRKSNIKDPNAPKKPLSAYFMFLQRIRSSPQLVRGGVRRGDGDDEAERAGGGAVARHRGGCMRMPTARGGGTGSAAAAMSNNFNFSILPGSPAFPAIKIESESESDRDGDGVFVQHQHQQQRSS